MFKLQGGRCVLVCRVLTAEGGNVAPGRSLKKVFWLGTTNMSRLAALEVLTELKAMQKQ
jgi:hypothetical protein